MAIAIDYQMLIDAFFPIGTTPRKSYENEKSIKWSIELPDVVQLSVTEKVKIAAVLLEAPCFKFTQQDISKLLDNAIDRANISRWRWKKDAKPDRLRDKYRAIWRNTTIMLVATYFSHARATEPKQDIFSYIQSTAEIFSTVDVKDIFEWRGERNLLHSSKSTLLYASFVEILKDNGLLTEDSSQKALDILSQGFEATIKYFSQKGLSLNTEQISKILRSPANPYFSSGLVTYRQYLHPRVTNLPAQKKTGTFKAESRQQNKPDRRKDPQSDNF